MTFELPIAVLFVGLVSIASAQDAGLIIRGETTEGRMVELPKASAGKYCIIAVAASKKAEPLLQEWYEPAYLRFVAKQGLFAGEYDADLWLVPVFTGLNKAAFGPSMKRLKEEADPEIAQRVVFVKDDSDVILTSLGIKDREQPYFFVFGPDGVQKHCEKGAFTVEKLDALEEAMTP